MIYPETPRAVDKKVMGQKNLQKVSTGFFCFSETKKKPSSEIFVWGAYFYNQKKGVPNVTKKMREERLYKKRWPERYAIVSACYDALRRADHQFPEAVCPIASRLLCEVMSHCVPMCGRFRSTLHIWCFDTRARVHVDLTRGQFRGATPGLKFAVYNSEGIEQEGYELSSLAGFNEAMGLSYMKSHMEDISVGDTTLAQIASSMKRMKRLRRLTHEVVLNVDLFRSSRVLRQKRVAWPEYTEFMFRCGFEAHRDDKHGFPRVCVEPFDGAPFFSDCLGMTDTGNDEAVARLCSAHIRHVARLMWTSMRDRCFDVSDAFWRRNVECDGFFVLSEAA
jgi:hypothetical protein